MEDSTTYQSATEPQAPIQVSTAPYSTGIEAALKRAAAKAIARARAAGLEPVIYVETDSESTSPTPGTAEDPVAPRSK